ncbi:GPI transamidase component PIG-S [Rhinatrema bivittatum]|uniref:GPI transamidase component PIG-S n=1 Tax=Rhinatrema bivittatum TaxID=194408 RepID=UPI00112A4F69|nr:GPI transamidase component PIG-S [Rhinatrema bivittatum]
MLGTVAFDWSGCFRHASCLFSSNWQRRHYGSGVRMVVAAVEALRGKYTALCIAAIVLVVGLPLWWKTTETYRASLPYSEISKLETLRLHLTVLVDVIFAKGTLTGEQQRRLPASQSREKDFPLNSKTSFVRRYEFKYRGATAQEEAALRTHSLPEADEALQRLNKASVGLLSVYVIPETSTLLLQGTSGYMGKHRSAVLKSAWDPGLRTEEILTALLRKVERIVQAMTFTDDVISAALSDRVPIGSLSSEAFADNKRAFKSNLGYEITFSLLNPDPKSHDLHWNIEAAVDNYIQPFLDKLAFVANFSVDSQILYYVLLGVTPRYDKNTSSYILNANSLPHVINPLEARLGSSAASLYPVLNFLLYVPESVHSPLYIQNLDGSPVTTNAFHSPRWGGIMVYNVNYRGAGNMTFPVRVDIDMVPVMEVFLTQLRLLFGISRGSMPADFLLESPGNEGLTDWELDRLLWSRTVENIATVSTTLTSLAQLLDQIGNIVINDNVASEVYRAVDSVHAAMLELEAGRLEPAFRSSKDAITSSEKAFFDPSLLHLLYFPDDQKFAIYIPLFLPMAVPILLSLIKIAKEQKQREKEPSKSD